MATAAESSASKSGMLPHPLNPATPPPAPPRRWGRRLLWLLLAAAVAGGAWHFGFGRRHGEPAASASATAAKEPTVVAVTTAKATARPVRRTVPIVGTFYGLDEVALNPKADGRIIRILKDVGDVVRPGDLLLEIEEVDHKLAVDEAQRALDLELAKLGLKAPPGESFEVAKLPAVVKAESLEKNAKARRDRIRSMGRAGAQEEWDQVETDWQIAKANFDQAVMEAETTLASVRLKLAQLATAKQRLAETKVRVPAPSPDRLAEIKAALAAAPTGAALPEGAAYVVAERLVSEGEMVRTAAAAPVFRLVLDRPLKLKGTVPERHSAEVKVGQQVAITVEAFPGETFAGAVSRVNPTIDRSSRTFQAEVLVPNQERRLRAGGFSKAAIATRTEANALTVPEEAVSSFAGVTKVFIVKGGKAASIPVEVGTRLELSGNDGKRESWVEVFGGLKPGDTVVTSGQTQLADGTPVKAR